MKKEFMVDRQGKSFVLYAGLLDEAHARGLKSITTSLLQPPSGANGDLAVCAATVEMGDGRTFAGIGDASPQNVNEMMRHCLIRMAETRAKARALRDAVNVGMAALEELEGATECPSVDGPDVVNLSRAAGSPRPTAVQPRAATEAQLRAIYSIAQGRLGMDRGKIEAESRHAYAVAPEGLTKGQASDFIDRLKSEARKA